MLTSDLTIQLLEITLSMYIRKIQWDKQQKIKQHVALGLLYWPDNVVPTVY